MSATIDISCVKVEPEQEEKEETTWETDMGVSNIVHQAENNLDIEIGPVKIETETIIERQTARPRNKKQPSSVSALAAKGYTVFYLCPHCPRQFERSDELEIHTQIHTDKLLYKCTYCPNSFSHKSIFTAHMYGHTGKFPYNCPDCPEGFLKNCDLKKHMRLHASKCPSDVHNGKNSLQCPQCPRGFMTTDELEIHLQIHSDKLPHKCPYCPDSFAHKSNFLSHICEHTGEFPFKCPECQQGFMRRFDLTRHLRSDCDKGELNKNATMEMEEELIRTSPKSNMDEAIIENCNIKQEQSNFSLQSTSTNPNAKQDSEHKQTADDKRCPSIKVENLDVDNLNVEISQFDDNISTTRPLVGGNKKSKSKKRSNQCKICKRTFKRIKDMRLHQRSCTRSKRKLRARQYICYSCSMSFAQAFKLKAHMRRHLGERSYKCPHCPRTFVYNSDLMTHIRRCSRSFANRLIQSEPMENHDTEAHKLLQLRAYESRFVDKQRQQQQRQR
ncbi:hypothetical protein ACLKA7_003849 [Drosophila subpalustris]